MKGDDKLLLGAFILTILTAGGFLPVLLVLWWVSEEDSGIR
jgi:hypothetical protein